VNARRAARRLLHLALDRLEEPPVLTEEGVQPGPYVRSVRTAAVVDGHATRNDDPAVALQDGARPHAAGPHGPYVQEVQDDLIRPVSVERLAQYNVIEARMHFSRLIERAATGERIVIARAGEPVAELGPYRADAPRVPGVVTAKIHLDAERLPRGRL
jgi:prevent-host-death family protein